MTRSERDNERVQQGHVPTELMSAYLDAHVSEEERRQVENHLLACETCSAVLESLRRTVAVLRALPSPRLPRSFVIGPQAVHPRVVPLWGQPHLMRAFSGLAAAAMAVLLVADALGLGAMPMSQQAAAPMAKVEAPLRGLRQEPAAPADRIDESATPRQDRAAPAAGVVAAERPAATPASAGLVAPPAAPVMGLRASEASEAATPGPDATFSASRAAAPPAEAPVGRLSEEQSLRRDSGAAPSSLDETTVSAPEPRTRASEQVPPPATLAWPKLAAIALGLIAVALWVLSLRWARRA